MLGDIGDADRKRKARDHFQAILDLFQRRTSHFFLSQRARPVMDHHQQKDFMSSVLSPGQDQQQNPNMFPPFPTNTGAMPQSPNNAQLTMGLLNNLMQMQGLDTQSLSASSSSNSNTTSFDSQLLEQQIKLTQLQQLQQLQNQIFQQQVCGISHEHLAFLSDSGHVDCSH